MGFSTQILLQIVLPEVRGRIFSTEIAFSMLMSAVGASIGGYYLEWFGIAGAVRTTALLTLLPCALWVGWAGLSPLCRLGSVLVGLQVAQRPFSRAQSAPSTS